MIFTVTLNPALDKEYTVSQIAFDEVMRMQSLQIDFGGKGFNVSRMLTSLGEKSTALGFVGGHTGDAIKAGLESLKIPTDLSIIQGETRTNISIVEQGNRRHVKLNEEGPQVSALEVAAFLNKLDKLIHEGDFWVVSGSLPKGVPPDIYAQVIKKINQAGAFAILDSSGLPLQLGIEEKPYLIKPNIYELSTLMNTDIDNVTALPKIVNKLHEEGIRLALVSMGEDGAFLSDSRSCFVGKSPKISEKNPIGAGDAMVAGMTWRLAQGDAPQVALQWAMACGTAAASLAGTKMPVFELVEEYFDLIEITEL